MPAWQLTSGEKVDVLTVGATYELEDADFEHDFFRREVVPSPSWKKVLGNIDGYPTFEPATIIIRRIRMSITGIAYIVCFYVLVASGETLNGIARTVFLNKRIGVVRAKRVSMLSGLLICLLICYLYVPQMGINSDSGLLFLGISLSLFMLFFDIALGRFVMKLKWSTIFAEMNIFKGNLLAAGAIVMAFFPLLSAKLPRIF